MDQSLGDMASTQKVDSSFVMERGVVHRMKARGMYWRFGRMVYS
jgi:hypothetical protein